MSRIWVWVILWIVALVAVALLIPIISAQGSAQNAPLIAGLLIALQLSGLGLAAYSGVLAWRSRKTPRLIAGYAVPPLLIMMGLMALGPLVALSQTLMG